MKTPCEISVWYVLPTLRQELAKTLIDRHGLSQVQVAKKLGVTEAAVSQYLSKKRGNLTLTKSIKEEIKKSAEKIVKGDEAVIVRELCRVCNLIQDSKILPDLYRKHCEY